MGTFRLGHVLSRSRGRVLLPRQNSCAPRDSRPLRGVWWWHESTRDGKCPAVLRPPSLCARPGVPFQGRRWSRRCHPGFRARRLLQPLPSSWKLLSFALAQSGAALCLLVAAPVLGGWWLDCPSPQQQHFQMAGWVSGCDGGCCRCPRGVHSPVTSGGTEVPSSRRAWAQCEFLLVVTVGV